MQPKIRNTCGLLVVSVALPLHAGEVADPVGMLTHELCAETRFYMFGDEDVQLFSPASSLAECARAQVGSFNCAQLTAMTQCLDPDQVSDMVAFTWINHNMHSDTFGLTATGTAMTTISLASDAIISLDAIDNIDMLDDDAKWSIDVFDEDDLLVGSLLGEDSLSLEKEMEYDLVFTIGGSNTLTTGGSTVSWDIRMEYSSDYSAVPGAGGLALVLGFGGRRRRRRNTAQRP